MRAWHGTGYTCISWDNQEKKTKALCVVENDETICFEQHDNSSNLIEISEYFCALFKLLLAPPDEKELKTGTGE